MSVWRGRADREEQGDCRRWHQVVQPLAADSPAGVTLFGVCSDIGVRRNQGRAGAAQGPLEIRRQLASLAWHGQRPLYDAGNLLPVDDNLEQLQQEQAGQVAKLLSQGHFPLVLGGGHEIAFGNLSGLLSQLLQGNRLGIINFDAHFDLRQARQASSGTPFLQAAQLCRKMQQPFHYCCLGISEPGNTRNLFQRASELGVSYLRDDQLNSWQLPAAEKSLGDFIARLDTLYLSIDLDVLPVAVAPGVSAPAARGIPLEILEQLLDCICQSAGDKLKLADLAEYNPRFDIDQRTARVAARLCHLLIRNRNPKMNRIEQ